MKIGGREIGRAADVGPYVIAEIGVNHDGSLDRALQLVDAAADAGADAVKVQVFEAERLMGSAARLAAYQAKAGEVDPVSMLRRLELPLSAMEKIVERAHARRVHAIATVFSVELVDGAAELGFDAFKSASPDIVHRPLLEAMAGTERPLIVSTGAATMAEVTRAAALLSGIANRLAMLQCVSSYPTPLEQAALSGIEAIARATGLPTGYSDHTSGSETGALAVAAGACVLEKHLTYDKGAAGPDHSASLDAGEMRDYIALARRAWSQESWTTSRRIAGGVDTATAKRVLDVERDVRLASRQSIVLRRAMCAGDVVRHEDVTFKRPGSGLEPWRLDDVIGRRLATNVGADLPLSEGDLQ